MQLKENYTQKLVVGIAMEWVSDFLEVMKKAT